MTVLRHYGLTLVLLSVLKLAAVDTASQNSIIRVVSLAAAGIVCFVLSLLYNRYAQEQRRTQMEGMEGADDHNRSLGGTVHSPWSRIGDTSAAVQPRAVRSIGARNWPV